MTKNPFQSKTVIFNVLFVIVFIAGAFGFAGFNPDDRVKELASVIVAVINIILRFKTYTPINFSVWRK